jgi:hypothetical protein
MLPQPVILTALFNVCWAYDLPLLLLPIHVMMNWNKKRQFFSKLLLRLQSVTPVLIFPSFERKSFLDSLMHRSLFSDIMHFLIKIRLHKKTSFLQILLNISYHFLYWLRKIHRQRIVFFLSLSNWHCTFEVYLQLSNSNEIFRPKNFHDLWHRSCFFLFNYFHERSSITLLNKRCFYMNKDGISCLIRLRGHSQDSWFWCHAGLLTQCLLILRCLIPCQI